VTKHEELHWHTASDDDAFTAEDQGCGIESLKMEEGAGDFFSLLTGRGPTLKNPAALVSARLSEKRPKMTQDCAENQ
jgi:hypothetical protein